MKSPKFGLAHSKHHQLDFGNRDSRYTTKMCSDKASIPAI